MHVCVAVCAIVACDKRAQAVTSHVCCELTTPVNSNVSLSTSCDRHIRPVNLLWDDLRLLHVELALKRRVMTHQRGVICLLGVWYHIL